MATSTGYDYSVRQGLNQKGVTNDRITYDSSKGVMVDGNNFYKPEKVYQGTSFTNQNNFNQAWDSYNKTQNAGSAATGSTGTTANTGYTYDPYKQSNVQQNPYTSQTDQVIQQLMNYSQNQPAFDPYSSSGYQAAQAHANRAAQQNTRATQEAYGSAGFGRSSAMGERIAGVQNDATEYLMTQVLPQIEAQEQARRQQEYNNSLSALQQLVGQQNRADDLVQNSYSNRIAEGQLTGSYINPEAESIINHLLGLKQQAEDPNIARNDMLGLSSQADTLRDRLSAMGIDATQFGKGVTANQAGQNKGAVSRTLQGKTQDYNQAADQREFDYKQDRDNVSDQQWQQEVEYTQGRDAVKDQQWMQEFSRLIQEDGRENALKWAANSISQQNANTSAGNLTLSRDEFNYRKTQDGIPKASKESSATPVASKDSYDLYNGLLDDIGSGATKSQAQQLLDLNSEFLTDADYRKLSDYIRENM